MTFEQIQEKLDRIEKDSTLQNLIAQANARYILYNTSESIENFPKYTIKDDKLNLLAFHYLNLGCRFIENEHLKTGVFPLEKGASILENVHGSPEVRTKLGNYYGLISALSYYVCFQYSKAFILIKKIENDTVISKIVSLFLSRNYQDLQVIINSMMVNEIYTDDYLSENNDEIDSDKNIYEITIAKSLNNFIKYFYTGEKYLLELAKTNLKNLKIITEVKNEPDVWWVLRLLIIITDGISKASLWDSLEKYFDTSEGLVRNYIHSLTYKKYGGIYELFITQRNSLSKVISEENNGCVVSIPTSSGKTRIAEIAILDSISKNKGSKVLYIAPFRSLAYEIENSLDEIFYSIGISVSHLYGGSLFSKLDEKVIDESDVIIATPEKAKAMLRGNNEILNQIKLVVIDEGHLLGANKRLIVNEIFYEELRYFIAKNNGRFLLLSAVLPNAEDLAEWLTNSRENVFKENWKPSDERLGVLQWNGDSVDLNWRSTDTERNSFNPKFITSEEIPLIAGQRKIRFYPENKNQAVARTALKLNVFGPVLIFVGLKDSVFTIAKEYDRCLDDEVPFPFENKNDWNAFELACIETYGEESEWLYFARKGILCHNSNLLSDVRLPLERLMSKEKVKVIIATSTLGQGVNLGISTVIFSTLYQSGNLITSRDFWNIAGRAGRAFVDHEGKILIAYDNTNGGEIELFTIKSKYPELVEDINKYFVHLYRHSYAFKYNFRTLMSTAPLSKEKKIKLLKTWSNKSRLKRRQDWSKSENTEQINTYFDKAKIDKAQSGCLELIKDLKAIANDSDVSFELLLELIAENNIADIPDNPEAVVIDNKLDWIDDGLLSLHSINSIDNSYEWTDDYFRNSLAFIQAEKSEEITGEEVIQFLKARTKGIIKKVGNDRLKWKSIIKSGIPLNSDLQIEDKLDKLISIIQKHLISEINIDAKIELLKKIENEINDINVLSEEFIVSEHQDAIREQWIKAVPLSEIAPLINATEIITKYYSFTLPWVLNGIAKKLANEELIRESESIEELSILVELGLPNLISVKIYQSGIRSRTSANEISGLYEEELLDKSIKFYKNDLINNIEKYKGLISERASKWIVLLSKFSNRETTKLKPIPNFTFGDIHNLTSRLLAREINKTQYLTSPDLKIIENVSDSKIDFSSVNNVNGVFFDYDENDGLWKMTNLNPTLKFEE
jgi:hypothetical protein